MIASRKEVLGLTRAVLEDTRDTLCVRWVSSPLKMSRLGGMSDAPEFVGHGAGKTNVGMLFLSFSIFPNFPGYFWRRQGTLPPFGTHVVHHVSVPLRSPRGTEAMNVLVDMQLSPRFFFKPYKHAECNGI